MLKFLKDNIAIILLLLALAGGAAYSLWFRHLPQAEGRITGDYAEGVELSGSGLPLFVAVDYPPH